MQRAPSSEMVWKCGAFRLSLARPLIMGIVNVTPDSFSDGGEFFAAAAARAQAQRLIDEGADIIDIGGESTRPGAAAVLVDEERLRVVPLVEALRDSKVAISVDTSQPEVMRAALNAGAAIINDVRALQMPGALETAAASDCGVVLMHMQGTPQTMQDNPRYDDVVGEVADFLRQRRSATVAAGIAADRIALDPGFGFGKSVEHNYRLLGHLREFAALDAPLLIGISRKGMLKNATGRSVGDRAVASAAAALIAVQAGAHIVRVHDVAATRDALAVWRMTQEFSGEEQ